jgi:hypothetical protein
MTHLDQITVDMTIAQKLDMLILAASEQQDEIVLLKDCIREVVEYATSLEDKIDELQDELTAA